MDSKSGFAVMYSCFDNFMKFSNVFLYIFEKGKKHPFLEHIVNKKKNKKERHDCSLVLWKRRFNIDKRKSIARDRDISEIPECT